jgi:hypothetical protein
MPPPSSARMGGNGTLTIAGAAPGHFMTHLSITEAVPGDERPEADWGDHVTTRSTTAADTAQYC